MFDFSEKLLPFVGRYDQILIVQSRALHDIGSSSYPTLEIDDQESDKNIATVERIWSFLMEYGATRSSLLVNVGGGVVTDLGGFAAATFKRGMDYVNIPTTLLSMVDAGIGGKTGIDYGQIKNMIGAFQEPVNTIIDPRWLATLSSQQLLSGYAEMLKHGLIADEHYWNQLLAVDIQSSILNPQSSILFESLILRSAEIKRSIVSQDPKETGLRKALNFGHTIGHALEGLSTLNSPLSTLSHGYAVLYGMIAESYLSHVLLDLDKGVITQLASVMNEYYGKPQCNCKDTDRLIELMRQDKKNLSHEQINFTLLKSIGNPVINQVADVSLIRESIDYLMSL
ncbi:MAG: 3-dehydroquinate synthase [Paludibacteraceae bacterium]|nr:3-dehydroquinate synthase [Paludibacteraceae bacterium]